LKCEGRCEGKGVGESKEILKCRLSDKIAKADFSDDKDLEI